VARLKAIQADIHKGFIDLVRTSRGSRLTGPESALFTGEYWVGSKALELGLVDRISDLRTVLRERYGDKVRTPLIAERGWFGRRLPGVGQSLFRGEPAPLTQAGFADEILSAIEARTIWGRYGF
jgi:serine protease SohB